MELYGSLLNISGSVTASTFTGSFIGDGSGLTGIQASGVTGLNLSRISNGDATASISPSGFTVNKDTQIQGNLSVTGALIANEYIVSSSVIYMTTSFASGSSAFGNDNNDVHQFTGSVQITGSISLNGQAIGTGKLDETTFQSYTSSNNSRVLSLETSSGSLNSFTSSINTTIKSKLNTDNVISGSVQVNITGTTGYSTFSSSVSNSINGLSSSVATTTSGLTSTITSLSSSVGSLSSSNATTDLNQDNRLNALETSSGSLNSFTSSINTTIKSKLNADGVISGSSQILNGANIVSSSTQVTAYGFATTGSNLFKGTQTYSGSILPSVDNTYDLGSVDYQWRDVYISSGSLYIDGTKVLSSTAQELIITTDNGQSLKILEGTTDSIILQTADGDIELKSSADGDILLDPTNGKIMLKGPVEIFNGNKIQSSVGGTPVVFANDIVVSGSIDLTGTIDGIDLQSLSSSLNTKIGGIETATGSLNSYTSSNTTNINAIHTSTSSLNSFTSSINTTIKSKLNSDGVISGSVQVVLTGTTGYSTFSSSVSASIGTLSGSIATTTSGLSSSVGLLSSSVATTTSGLGSTISSLSSSVATTTSGLTSTITSLSSSVAITTSGLSSSIGSLSSSVATTTSNLSSSVATTTSGISTTVTNLSSSVATTTLNQSGRLTSIEGKTGSFATTGSNIFQGNQTITGSLYVSQDLIIAGSSSIQHISSSVVNIADNIITVNAQNPSIRFGGLAVIDSGSSPQVSGSILFDSVNDQWIFVHQNQTTVTSSVVLMGPQTFNNLGNETFPTNNRLLKSVNAEHLGDSNISDNGTTVTILSNTVINGTISATGTTLVSGSSQISHDSTTGYVANRHIDHTAVSITAGNGLSGGGDISATRTVSLDTTSATFTSGVKTKMNTDGVISGSSQVLNGSGVWSGSAQLPSGVVSGSSQIIFSGITGTPTGLVSGSSQITFLSVSGIPAGLVSGSSQVLLGSSVWSGSAQLPSGVVSGSSQVLNGTTIHSGSFFNGIAVVSGSAQVSFNGITDKPTLVSGSSQITYGSISSIPSGIVSGSVQVDLTATTNYSSGIKTRLNAEGVLSGSAQVVAALPSGTVSGSAQITLSSTTGYGSVLNQAVLTTSAVTFAGITNNGAYSGSGGSFSHNVGNPAGTTELFVHNGANTPVPFRMTKAGYTGAGGSYGILQLYMNDNTNGNGSNLYFCANSSNGTFTEYGGIGMQIKSNTAGSATARLYFYRQDRGVNGTFDSDGTLYTVGNIYTNGNGTTTGNLVLNSSNFTGYTYSTTDADSRFLRGTTSPGTTGNFTLSIGNNGTYSYVQSHSSQPLELNPVGNTVRIAGNVALHAGNFTSYAMSGAGFSANQNLNTTNSPTFVGLTLTGDSIQLSNGSFRWRHSGDWVYAGNSSGDYGGGMGVAAQKYWSQGDYYFGTRGVWLSAYLNQAVLTNSNVSFNSVTGAITSSGNGDGNAPFRFGADYSGWMSIVAGAPGSNNGWGLFWAGNSGAQYGTNGASGPGDIWGNSGNPNEYVFVGNGLTAMSVYGNTGDVWMRGNLRVEANIGIGVNPALKFHVRGAGEMIRFENTSSASNEYTQLNFRAGSRNSYIWVGNQNTTSWAGAGGMNIYTDSGNIDLWTNTVQRIRVQSDGHLVPFLNNTYDLGSSSLGWRNVYTNDLHLSNMNKPEGNDVDGTNGNWTIQEGVENLYIINNNNGKKFKISLEEII